MGKGVNPFLPILTHFIRDTILIVFDILGNNFINTGNLKTYFTESCSGPNNNFFFNLSIQSWVGFIIIFSFSSLKIAVKKSLKTAVRKLNVASPIVAYYGIYSIF